MNFDELYKKYKDNTATDEERAYVEAEINKAKSISKILDADEPETEEKTVRLSDVDIIKKAKKKINSRNTLRTVIIVCICVFVIGALAVGAVAATVFVSANKSKTLSEEEAISVAKQCIAEHEGIADIDSIRIIEVDMDLEIRPNLVDSYFSYDIELSYDGIGYDVIVDASAGYAAISGTGYKPRNDYYDDRYDDYDDRHDDYDDIYDDEFERYDD